MTFIVTIRFEGTKSEKCCRREVHELFEELCSSANFPRSHVLYVLYFAEDICVVLWLNEEARSLVSLNDQISSSGPISIFSLRDAKASVFMNETKLPHFLEVSFEPCLSMASVLDECLGSLTYQANANGSDTYIMRFLSPSVAQKALDQLATVVDKSITSVRSVGFDELGLLPHAVYYTGSGASEKAEDLTQRLQDVVRAWPNPPIIVDVCYLHIL